MLPEYGMDRQKHTVDDWVRVWDGTDSRFPLVSWCLFLLFEWSQWEWERWRLWIYRIVSMALKILIESSRTNELPKGRLKMKRRERRRPTQTASIHQINVHNQTIVSKGREPHPGRRTYVIHWWRDGMNDLLSNQRQWDKSIWREERANTWLLE